MLTFSSAAQDLLPCPAFWRAGVTYTFDRSFTILSGMTGASVSGGRYPHHPRIGWRLYSGALQFSGSVSSLSGVSNTTVQRGNNRQAVFFGDDDQRGYLEWLSEPATTHGCAIPAYVLMNNHTHLLMTPVERRSVSDTLQALGRRFVPYINHSYGRTGTLWEGRFKANRLQEDAYPLTCHRCIELNPVRAGMVDDPADYRWSSYRANALGEDNPLLHAHPLYSALGADDAGRHAAYRELFAAGLAVEKRKPCSGRAGRAQSRFQR
jgi:putative transposase